MRIDDGGRLAPDQVASADVTVVLGALGTSAGGLTSDEAARRLAAGGGNDLPAPRGRGVLAEAVTQVVNRFALLLLAGAGLTFLTYLLARPRNPANLELAVGILAVVALNAAIGFAQEHAAERTAEALQGMVARTARVLRDGRLIEADAAGLVVGDVIDLAAGDAVAADCRILASHGLALDMATLTGESEPVRRTVDPPPAGTPPTEARNCAFLGTSVAAGAGRAVVTATGTDTEFGRIYRLTSAQRPEASPLQRQITHMANWVASGAVTCGLVVFGLRLATGNPAVTSFVFALAVMVALVPEGLPATLSVSLSVAVRRMAERHALVKRLSAVEALGSTTVICTDKTGTLTEARMTVEVVVVSGRPCPVPRAAARAPLAGAEAAEVLRVAGLCCDARLVAPTGGGPPEILGDTTEGAILVAAAAAGVDLAAAGARTPRVAEFPFDSERMCMSTVHRLDAGVAVHAKGALHAVLDRCARARWEGRTVPLDAVLRQRIEQEHDELAARPLRLLAVATATRRTTPTEQDEAESDLVFLGLIGMDDPPRPEVAPAVAACHRAGIRIIVVTGDFPLTAIGTARRVGIIGAGPCRTVVGRELDAMDAAALGAVLDGDDPIVFARVLPEHKLRIVLALEERGEVVAVTGDGANDAPALKRASVGIAMGRGGTDVARAAAVMVLLDDSFASIAAAVTLGRAVYQNVRHLLVYIFSHNLAELAPILVAAAVGFPLVPITALQVLLIDLGSDVLPGLALGTERPEPGTMDRRPRPPSEHLFSLAVLRRLLFLGALESAAAVGAFFWKIQGSGVPWDRLTPDTPVYRQAITMTMGAIMVGQLANSFTVRSDTEGVVALGLLSNRPLVLAGAANLAVALAVTYVPLLQRMFHTAALSLADWAVLVGFAGVLLAADEVRKAVGAAWTGRRAGAGAAV